MKRYMTPVLILGGLLLCGAALAADKADDAAMKSISGEIIKKCHEPTDKPTVPNGMKATKDDMLNAQQAIKTYVEKGNAYLSCLDDLQASWGDGVTDEQKAIIAIFHNKAVDDMQNVADLFNQAVRAFKGRSSE